jgi:hypothetical protein
MRASAGRLVDCGVCCDTYYFAVPLLPFLSQLERTSAFKMLAPRLSDGGLLLRVDVGSAGSFFRRAEFVALIGTEICR